MLRISDVVMISSWHEREGFMLQILRPRFGFGSELGLGLGLGWIFGSDGTGNGLSPLVLCDLGRGVVLVCPCIELLDLSVLQLALEQKKISGNTLKILQDILSACCNCP